LYRPEGYHQRYLEQDGLPNCYLPRGSLDDDWRNRGIGVPERVSPLELSPTEFRRLGHELVDQISDFLGSLRDRPVTTGETPAEIRALLGRTGLPETGAAPAALLPDTARLLFDHSLFNGHPRFMGYITSSAAPLGMLADLLAAAVNPNVGGWELSPMASEIEAQTVRWVAELVGYPTNCGGLLVSGGNTANFVCFLTGRRAMLGETARTTGLGVTAPLRVYASAGTHTWIQKAADLFGLGTDAIRWIPVAPTCCGSACGRTWPGATGRSW
jgi:glutamate/tyrosine decarboxylase-like PLP-dependent enzyme